MLCTNFTLLFFFFKVINPCAEGTDDCVENAQCVFSGISDNFTCVCSKGWTGDGKTKCTGRFTRAIKIVYFNIIHVAYTLLAGAIYKPECRIMLAHLNK